MGIKNHISVLREGNGNGIFQREFEAAIPGNDGKREGELYKNSKFNSRFYLNRQENWFVLFLFVQCLLKIHVFWPALF